MAQYRLSAAAQTDFIEIFAWTHEQFGESARLRYEQLIVTALRDIAMQPGRAGSADRSELGDAVRSWPLRLSRGRARTGTGIVRQPRHFLIYRLQDGFVVIGRILHDAIELERHLDAEDTWRIGHS